jgi:PII-like signaling protein
VSAAGVTPEPGLKLTCYFEERDRSGEVFLADALFDVYERHAMRTSVLLRGVVGFGQRHELHTERSLTLSESLPAVSVAVDTRERILSAVPDVLGAARHGLVSLERAWLASGTALGELDLRTLGGAGGDGFAGDGFAGGGVAGDGVAGGGVAAGLADGGLVKLTVYGGRGIRAGGDAGYVGAVDALQATGVDGALLLLGVDGTLHGERRRARFFARNAGVPLMLIAVGSAASLGAALPAVLKLIEEPVVTFERVQLVKSDGALVARPGAAPARDESGLPIWQKLMIHAEEQAHVGGRPLYLELARALRAAGAAGVTVLRAVRGFYGERGPFADRMLSLRRNVPMVVIAVDTPANVARWWPVVDELTAAGGLVTSELVPASHAVSAAGEADGGALALARTPTAPH